MRAVAAVPAEQLRFDLEPSRRGRRREVLYPIVCPGCGRYITDTAIPTAEAWCRRCGRWVKAGSPDPGGGNRGRS